MSTKRNQQDKKELKGRYKKSFNASPDVVDEHFICEILSFSFLEDQRFQENKKSNAFVKVQMVWKILRIF